jgi:hypothetical protein
MKKPRKKLFAENYNKELFQPFVRFIRILVRNGMFAQTNRSLGTGSWSIALNHTPLTICGCRCRCRCRTGTLWFFGSVLMVMAVDLFLDLLAFVDSTILMAIRNHPILTTVDWHDLQSISVLLDLWHIFHRSLKIFNFIVK